MSPKGSLAWGSVRARVATPHAYAEHSPKNGIGLFRRVKPVEVREMGLLGEKIPVQLIIPLVISVSTKQLDLLMVVISLVQDIEKMKGLVSLTELIKVTRAIEVFTASELDS